ncbi:MAG: hypothetical protein ACTSXH_16365 [Promethearchaeota archaeon]
MPFEKTTYVYEKPESNIRITKMPIWFEETSAEGNQENGYISWETINHHDEIWGAIAKIDLEYSKLERSKFFHPKEVQKTIAQFNAIDITVSKKENDWINSHELTIWYGTRKKLIRKRFYRENSIHAIFYCDMSERLFSIHASMIEVHYEGFKPFILNAFKSITCH